MAAPLTLSSLDELQVSLPPSSPAEVLRHLIITTLRRKGFDAAEAGALAEMERLLEHHVQHLFESATQYAAHATRLRPNAADALAAQDEALDARRLKRESRKRRLPIRMETVAGPSSPRSRTTLDLLVDFASEELVAVGREPEQIDRKPDLDDLDGIRAGSGMKAQRRGEVPEYAFDWAPGIPAAWMLEAAHVSSSLPPEPDIEPTPKVTSASMDFVKSTTVVGENIPPELGIVHFLKTGDRGKRRRMAG